MVISRDKSLVISLYCIFDNILYTSSWELLMKKKRGDFMKYQILYK